MPPVYSGACLAINVCGPVERQKDSQSNPSVQRTDDISDSISKVHQVRHRNLFGMSSCVGLVDTEGNHVTGIESVNQIHTSKSSARVRGRSDYSNVSGNLKLQTHSWTNQC